ncbi:hypothetical protein FB451DRAFT_1393217 [Mycena latifolia]|nr:hypothetical protein FB451DRAFT_1393217 [Mycena latifolia]
MPVRRFLSTAPPILATTTFPCPFDESAESPTGGIDLMGWWWLPPTDSDPRRSDSGSDAPKRRRLRVLAQCKAEKKKMGPNYVREMEGVLYRYMSLARPTPSGPGLPSASQDPLSSPTVTKDAETSRIGTAVWNPALAGVRGLLEGKMEARWERSLSGVGRPGLWWGGHRLRSWTPDGPSEELSMENEDQFFAEEQPL